MPERPNILVLMTDHTNALALAPDSQDDSLSQRAVCDLRTAPAGPGILDV